jgi:hypothetical protein
MSILDNWYRKGISKDRRVNIRYNSNRPIKGGNKFEFKYISYGRYTYRNEI